MFNLRNSQRRRGRAALRRVDHAALPRRFEVLEARLLLTTSSLVYPGPDGHLVYVPDAQGNVIPNFSNVGYMTGDVPLPDTSGGVSVPIAVTINPGAAGVDMTTTIQNAINSVSAMSLQSNGFRGAVLLTAGNYPISGALTISASGVVLEGQGNNATTGTRLEATGTTQRNLITVSGSGSMSTVSGTTHNITDSYVPVGATSFTVDSTANLHVGDTVIVQRPSTQAWIDAIGMETLTNPWTPGSKNLDSDRVITAINGNTITIDAPLTDALDQQYGGGTIHAYTWSGRLSNVGIENLYAYSDFTGTTDTDTTHATGSIFMDKVQNAWAENITSDNFATNVITTGSGAKWITFDHMTVQNTSQAQTNIDDAPSGFGNSGQEILYENGVFTNAYHAISEGGSVPGPNVYTNLTITDPLEGALNLPHSRDETGPHQRYATGGLFDDVSDTDWINIRNAGNEGSGHGWQGANFVLWNVNARTDVSSPPTAQNWIIGGTGSTSEGTGIYNQRGSTVTPTSLYTAQLLDRLTPTVATRAMATPGNITGKSTALSVLGADVAGESTLNYTWSTLSAPTGAPAVTFSANGTNASKNTTATFSQAGAYTFLVTIQYPGGFSVTSSINVVVNQTLTAIAVLPAAASINENTPQQFTGVASDQFGNPMPASITWNAAGGSITAGGLYTSSTTPGSYQITATGGSVIGSTNITVTSAAAAIANAASAAISPVTGTTTALSVLALGDTGQSSLTYTWSVTGFPSGATTPTFSVNGTNAAKNTTATFFQAGTYTFLVTVANSATTTATSSVSVVVNQTLTKITVSPSTVSLNENATRQFTAVATDQFNQADSVSITWATIGGPITSGGFFTAGTTPGGYTVMATSGSISGTANVSVNNAAPTIAVAASSSASPVVNATTNLNVLGSDDGGESNLTYTWSVTSKPASAATPTFVRNGNNASKATTATFFAPGSYTFLVTVRDASSAIATSSVTVTVQSAIASITISPSPASVGTTKSQQFTATAYDQFGVVLSSQTTFTWAVATGGAGGTISTTGLYTAPANTGTDTITATSGLIQGTVTVTVVPSSLGIFTAAADVGAPVIAGSSNYNTATSVYSVTGAGADISGTSDQFQYLYTTLTGDGIVTAEVTSFSAGSAATAKAGIMFRDSLDAGATDPFLCISASGNPIKLEGRNTDGGTATIDDSTAANLTAPYWIQLTRVGNLFSAYTSSDGSTWTLLGSIVVSMSLTVDVGLAVTSHNTAATTTATFQNVSIVPTPYIVFPANASPSPVSGVSTALNALANENGSAAGLTYAWAATAKPTGANPQFSVNGTSAAQNTTVTFNVAGSYTFQVTATDAANNSITSSVNVTVNQTLSSIHVSPPSTNLTSGQTQGFSATALDQFGNPMSAQPSFTWSVDNGSVGSVNSSGLYSAPLSPVGSATVRATSGAVSGTATVTVSYLKGDVNLDGHSNVADLLPLMMALTNLSTYQATNNLSGQNLLTIADINGDGHVNNLDIQALINLLLSGGGSTSQENDTAGASAATASSDGAIASPAPDATVTSGNNPSDIPPAMPDVELPPFDDSKITKNNALETVDPAPNAMIVPFDISDAVAPGADPTTTVSESAANQVDATIHFAPTVTHRAAQVLISTLTAPDEEFVDRPLADQSFERMVAPTASPGLPIADSNAACDFVMQSLDSEFGTTNSDWLSASEELVDHNIHSIDSSQPQIEEFRLEPLSESINV